MESSDHYSKVEIQPISYIIANNLDFCRGNIVKYVTRDKFKDKDKDVKKIIDYKSKAGMPIPYRGGMKALK